MTVGGTRLVFETRAWRLLHASGACLRACLVLASLNVSAPERGIVCKRHAAMPLCHYAAMPLCRYAAMPLCRYAAMPLCRYAAMPLCHYAAMPLCRYAAMPLRVCARQAQRRRHRQAFCWPNIT